MGCYRSLFLILNCHILSSSELQRVAMVAISCYLFKHHELELDISCCCCYTITTESVVSVERMQMEFSINGSTDFQS